MSGDDEDGGAFCANPHLLVEWNAFATALLGENEASELVRFAIAMPFRRLMRICTDNSARLTEYQIAFLRWCFGTRGVIGDELRYMRVIFEAAIGERTTVSNVPVHLKKGEEAYFHSKVQVIRHRTRTITRREYVGTRLKIGTTPIYLGTSIPCPRDVEVRELVGEGHLVITNTRIVLAGTKVNYTIPFDKILSVKWFDDAIQIMYEGRYGGYYYMTDAAREAAALLNTLLRVEDTCHEQESPQHEDVETPPATETPLQREGKTILAVNGDDRQSSENPDAHTVALALRELSGGLNSFAILSKGEDTYIQAAGGPATGFDLEYQDGSVDRHFRCSDRPLTLDRVTAAFLLYLSGDEGWMTEFRWEHMELTA